MSGISPKDIKAAIQSCLSNSLGTDWTVIKYVGDLEQNISKIAGSSKTYGVRALGGTQIDRTLKFLTIEQNYEIILVRNKLNTQIGDSDIECLVQENQEQVICCYKDIASSRLGISYVIMIDDLVFSDPEFIEDGKTVVQRANFIVTYRCVI